MAAASPDGAGSIKPPDSSRTDGRRRTCRGPGCSAGPNSCTRVNFQNRGAHLPGAGAGAGARVRAHSHSSAALLPPVGRFDWSGPVRVVHACFCCLTGPTQSPGTSMRLEAAARMDLFRKLWKARKLVLVVLIPLSLLPLPLIHPTSVSTHAPGDPRHRTPRLGGSWESTPHRTQKINSIDLFVSFTQEFDLFYN